MPNRAATTLMAALSGRRAWSEPFTIALPNGATVRARFGLCTVDRELAIEGEVARFMESIGLPATSQNDTALELERAKRLLADVVHDAEGDHPARVGTVSEWGLLAKEQIVDLYYQYLGFAAAHDPASADLTAEDMDAIRDAAQKKSSTRLRLFGVQRLASYLATTGGLPASSPTPTSSPGDSSPAP